MKNTANLTECKLARALRPRNPWWAAPGAFFATLLAIPVHAGVVIPGDPLASGVRVAPNILFILDDSGSMAWEHINNVDIPELKYNASSFDTPGYDGVGTGYTGPASATASFNKKIELSAQTGNEWAYEQNYVTNSLYYNPAVDYQPWMGASGKRINVESAATDGTDYTKAYYDTANVAYTGVESNTTSTTTDLSNSTRTFYAPKGGNKTTAYLTEIANYYRYQILSGGARIMQGEYSTIAVTNNSPSISTSSGTATSTAVNVTTGAVTSGRSVEFTIANGASSGGSAKSLNYWVYAPSSATVCSGTITKNSSTPCVVSSAEAGSYTIRLQRSNSTNVPYTLSARTSTSCDGIFSNGVGWANCTESTPTGRTLADEKTNFATWYSYFRSRIKAAKAGAAEAFNTQGNKVRVGYRTLQTSSSGGVDNFSIPVKDGNDGRFVNNDGTNGNPATKSRSKWFNRLFKADPANGVGTPLQYTLDLAGKYFQGMADTGPYGPESGTNQLSCRQNFTVLTTDGYWNGGAVSVSTSGDNINGSLITNNLPTTDPKYKGYQYIAKDPYQGASGNGDTLADVAMKYWKTDLRTDLDNNVPSDYSKVASENDKVGRDPAFWQHMVTFTISIGLKTSKGWSSIEDVPLSNPGWPTPSNDNKANLDDLLHAALNGRGTFVSASSPQAFADGLEAALAKISERTASLSNVGATSSTELKTNTLIFSASYVAGRWSGLLRAENAVTGAEVWKTTSPGIFTAYGSRKVYTRSGTLTGGVGASGINGGNTFPTPEQTAVLTRTGGPANYEVTGLDNANYIKGDQSLEGATPGKLRTRATVLGDIVNSSPAFVTDTNTVYIGGNDGMLHAFNSANGEELFAYVPGIINFGKLADLSRRDYDHSWFVDGPITVSSRPLSPDGAKNILVGALGRGGKGVYALDVTNPAAFGTGNVKWEMNATSATTADNHMGMVLGTPVLAKVRASAGATTSAVVLGNGINSASDKAALIVLKMDDGSVIRQIDTSAYGGPSSDNGLFAPTGIYAADGKTLIYVYAGDLQGNVWKFDLTSTDSSSWSAKKIFQAGAGQVISGGIASAIDARTNKRWIFFGTGSFMTALDANDMSVNSQSMYGLIDDTTGSAYTRTNLVARTVTAGTGTDVGERYFQDLTGAMMTGKSGWYVDLPDKGERIVQNAQMDGSFLVTASMMPSGNSCSDASGSGYINAITPFPDMQVSGKSYFDLDNDGSSDDTGTNGKPTGSIKTTGIPTLPLLLPGQGRYGTADGVGKYGKGRPQWNRVSWRELRND